MDEACSDISLTCDPFLEAGIDIPKDLPYQKPEIKKNKSFLEGNPEISKFNSIEVIQGMKF